MTHSPTPRPERRCARTEFPYEAVNCLLRGIQRRSGLGSLALGDEDGLVVAGAGTPANVERLALWGALSAVDQGDWREEVDAFFQSRPFFSMRVAIGPTKLRLSGIGAGESIRDEVERGLARILGARLGPMAD
jgi:hypothetical protein